MYRGVGMVHIFPGIEQIVFILVLGVIGGKLAERLNIPVIMPLLISGFVMGPEMLGLFEPSKLGLSLSTLAFILIPLILFDDGMHIEADVLRRIGVPVFLLATMGVVVSTVGVGLISHYFFGLPIITSMLIGAILAATDPGAVIAITKYLRIDKRLSTLVEAESAFNDASSFVLTTVLIAASLGEEISIGGAVFSFVRLLFGGMLSGIALSLLAREAIEKFKLYKNVEVTSLVLFLTVYSFSELIQTSGITAVVASAIIFGDYLHSPGFRVPDRLRTTKFWDNIVFIAQSIIFLVLGAGISQSIFVQGGFEGIVITIFLFIFIRPLTVLLSTSIPTNLSIKEQLFVSSVGARGAIAAGLAAIVVGAGVPEAMTIFNIVLVVVVITLLVVGFTARHVTSLTLGIKPPKPFEEYQKRLADHFATRKALIDLEVKHSEDKVDLRVYEDLRSELLETLENLETELESYRSIRRSEEEHTEEELLVKKDIIRSKIDAVEDLRSREGTSEAAYESISEKYLEELSKIEREIEGFEKHGQLHERINRFLKKLRF